MQFPYGSSEEDRVFGSGSPDLSASNVEEAKAAVPASALAVPPSGIVGSRVLRVTRTGGEPQLVPQTSANADSVEEEGPAELESEQNEESADPADESESVLTLYLSRQEQEAQLGPPDMAPEELRDAPINYVVARVESQSDRARTAPSRPLTELEELRASRQFLNLETAAIAAGQLVQRADDKFDVDSLEGQKNCRSFLQELEKLFDSFRVPHASRLYRNKFSQAYRVLYTEGALCYLTEILDSAQEGTCRVFLTILIGFPFLWVNSEKYIFSADVLKSAKDLYHTFGKLKHVLRNIYTRYAPRESLTCEIDCARRTRTGT